MFGKADENSADTVEPLQQGTFGENPELSVIIVTYNEEDRIRDCIQSIFDACEDCSFEVILVDSNSTDQTIAIADSYPITIYRLPSDEINTPGAGRHVGTKAARGDQILFVDGDMELRKDWLDRARPHIQQDGIAAVDGHLIDMTASVSEISIPSEVESIDAVRGVALYDRAALREVGGFDPYLRSLEDIHLGTELTAAGYDLHRLPAVAAAHPKRTAVREPFRRLQRGYMFGPGQVLRKTLSDPQMLRRYLFRFRFRIALFLWLVVGVGSALFWPLALLWAVSSLIPIGYVFFRLGTADGSSFLLNKFLGVFGLLAGLALPQRPAHTYPADRIEVIQNGQVHLPLSRERGERRNRK